MPVSITTLDMIKDAANIPRSVDTWDAQLDLIAAAAEDMYQKKYQRLVKSTTFTDEPYYQVTSPGLLALRNIPVTSITAVKAYLTEDTANPDLEVVASAYRLRDSESGLIEFMVATPLTITGLMDVMVDTPIEWAKVAVSYVAGMTAIPNTIKRGMAMFCADMFGRIGHQQNLSNLSIAGVTNAFFDDSVWSPAVLEMLSGYDTKVRVGVI